MAERLLGQGSGAVRVSQMGQDRRGVVQDGATASQPTLSTYSGAADLTLLNLVRTPSFS